MSIIDDFQSSFANMNPFQGVINIGESVLGSLTKVATAATDVTVPHITVDNGQVVASGQGAQTGQSAGTLDNIKSAISKIGEIFDDAKSGNAIEGVKDGFDLLKLIFAVLDTFGINVPVVSMLIRML